MESSTHTEYTDILHITVQCYIRVLLQPEEGSYTTNVATTVVLLPLRPCHLLQPPATVPVVVPEFLIVFVRMVVVVECDHGSATV